MLLRYYVDRIVPDGVSSIEPAVSATRDLFGCGTCGVFFINVYWHSLLYNE
jgi:hypothetical protein